MHPVQKLSLPSLPNRSLGLHLCAHHRLNGNLIVLEQGGVVHNVCLQVMWDVKLAVVHQLCLAVCVP